MKTEQSKPCFLSVAICFSEFPEVFDDEAYSMTPAMKSMRVDIRECRLKGDPVFGGQRTCPKIDNLVPEH